MQSRKEWRARAKKADSSFERLGEDGRGEGGGRLSGEKGREPSEALVPLPLLEMS